MRIISILPLHPLLEKSWGYGFLLLYNSRSCHYITIFAYLLTRRGAKPLSIVGVKWTHLPWENAKYFAATPHSVIICVDSLMSLFYFACCCRQSACTQSYGTYQLTTAIVEQQRGKFNVLIENYKRTLCSRNLSAVKYAPLFEWVSETEMDLSIWIDVGEGCNENRRRGRAFVFCFSHLDDKATELGI